MNRLLSSIPSTDPTFQKAVVVQHANQATLLWLQGGLKRMERLQNTTVGVFRMEVVRKRLAGVAGEGSQRKSRHRDICQLYSILHKE
jgi:hypothetical protein